MVSRSPTILRITDIPTSGAAKEILGDNPRRVGLRLQARGAPDVILYDKPDPIDTARGWRLAAADGPMVFDTRDTCPRGSFFAAGSAAGAELQILEVTQEDIG